MDSESKPRLYRLYVLTLEDGKYYVGVTTKTVEQRMKEHLTGRSAYWTKDHKPLGIFYEEELGIMTYSEAEKLEQAAVRKYIKQLGLNNVRGGDLTDRGDYGLIGDRVVTAPDKQAFIAIIILLLIILILGLRLQFN